MVRGWLYLLLVLVLSPWLLAGQPDSSKPRNQSAREASMERGKAALLGRSFNPPVWNQRSYDQAWKAWGVANKPRAYAAAFRQRYGLHPAPYPNDGLPMGLRSSPSLLGKGFSIDCLVCHGGSIFGSSLVGLGNTSVDLKALFDELPTMVPIQGRNGFDACQVRGTTEAGALSVYLLGYRQPDLNWKLRWTNLGLHDDLCEDAPAWWLLKKKQTMYHTGSTSADSVRSIMQFMMSPFNTPQTIQREEDTFRDILAYIKSIEPPRYPLAIDDAQAAQGKELFRSECARCHGTYGQDWTYPNRIVPLKQIGTDPHRYHGLTAAFREAYNQSWFGQECMGWFADDHSLRQTQGYQAPPLDGVWATAPYFHNGSVPTVYQVLNSKARPERFTRSFGTTKQDYDSQRLGWKYQTVSQVAPNLSPFEKRKIYDTRQVGRGNAGHTFADHLSDAERFAIIEYLKTL